MNKDITEALLAWYDINARSLPWRGICGPYATWVSEVMLQQTRVETVLRYFPRFMQRFPTVSALAEADADDVLKMWEGLGYYRRAQNLHKGAKEVVSRFGGVMPQDPDTLRSVSGIGDYTAGAIASIACGKSVPAVDGNVIRVISRLAGIRENVGIPSVKRKVTDTAASLVPKNRPGDFNQALMDLGSAVCTPGTPDCFSCPLCTFCDAYVAGDAEDLPELPRKNPPKIIDYDVWILCSPDHQVLVRRRTEAMLQGLWIFPMSEGHRTIGEMPATIHRKLKLSAADVAFIKETKHVFTHQVWQMRIYTASVSATEAPAGWLFADRDTLQHLAMPTAVRQARKIADDLLTETTR